MLTEVALALRVLHVHPGRRHLVADPPQERLHAGPAEHRVVVVVEVGGLEIAIALVPRLLVGVLEDHELELSPGVRNEAAFLEPSELAPQDLPRRRDDVLAVRPGQVRHQEHARGVPRDRPQRVQVGLHLEVAVAALPGGHGVARDRVHLDVDRQEVVAALGAVLEHVVEEKPPGETLPLKAALHVREDEHHGVDRAVIDRLLQLIYVHFEVLPPIRFGNWAFRAAAYPGDSRCQDPQRSATTSRSRSSVAAWSARRPRSCSAAAASRWCCSKPRTTSA